MNDGMHPPFWIVQLIRLAFWISMGGLFIWSMTDVFPGNG